MPSRFRELLPKAVELGHVIAEIERLDDPIVAKYLGDWGTRTHWESVIGRPLGKQSHRL